MKDKSKEFLSDSHEEFGSISWYVTNEKEYRYGIDAEVRITDCYKEVTLDFACTPDRMHKRLKKIDTLIESLERFRASMQKAAKQEKQKSRPY